MTTNTGIKRQSSFEHLEFCNRLVRRSALKYPWDFNLQYNPYGYLDVVRPAGMAPVTNNSVQKGLADDEMPSAPPILCKRFWMKQPRIDWEVKLNAVRESAIVKWQKIVAEGPTVFEASRYFFLSIKEGHETGTLFDSLKNVFASKSTSTLNSRVGPMIRYVFYCQISGRLGKLALSELRELERCKKSSVVFDVVQISARKVLLDRYRDSAPRILRLEGERPPILLFTDGACEEEAGELFATAGGVLFHPEESLPRAFGCEVCEKVLKSWMDADKVHPVSLTELYAVCLSRSIWKSQLDNQKVVVFIDNQGVLDACIKGWSGEEQMKSLLLHFEMADGKDPFFPWFARVPSSSNCADYPSRGLWSKLKQLVGEFVSDEAQCFITSQRLKTLTEAAAIAEEHGDHSEKCHWQDLIQFEVGSI